MTLSNKTLFDFTSSEKLYKFELIEEEFAELITGKKLNWRQLAEDKIKIERSKMMTRTIEQVMQRVRGYERKEHERKEYTERQKMGLILIARVLYDIFVDLCNIIFTEDFNNFLENL